VEEAVKALASILDVLLSIVISIVKGMVNYAVQPIVSLFTDYVSTLWGDIQDAEVTVSQGYKVTPAEAQQFWSDFAGNLFIVGMGIGVAIVIVITFVEGLTFGTGFLLTLIVGIIIALVAQAAMSYAKSAFSSIPSFGSPGVTTIENFVGGLVSLSSEASSTFETLGELFDAADSIYSSGVGLIVAGQYYGLFLSKAATQDDVLKSVIGLDLALITTALDVVALVAQKQGNSAEVDALLISSDILGGYSIFIDVTSPPDPLLEPGGIYTLDRIDNDLDFVSEGVSLAETVAYLV
jgi:hypothetical protein